MIIFLLSVLVLIIGIIYWNFSSDGYVHELISITLVMCGLIFTLTGFIFILVNHIGVNVEIETKQIEYESLCKRLEIVNSIYEDVSKSEVVKDIANWNLYVTKSRYWTYNPWTSWFYSKKLTDSLKYIELEEKQ